MKKFFMYDADGMYIVPCQLVGMNECGEPQLVVTTPGVPVTSLKTFMDDAEIRKMYYLCDEGQKLSSLRVVRVLSPIIKFMDQNFLENLIDDMKRFRLKWSKEPVKITAIPSKSADKDEESPYSLQIVLYDYEGIVSFEHYYSSFAEMLESLSIFQRTLKVKAGIELKMKLFFSRHFKTEVPEEYKEIFDEIDYPYEK